jgi:guanylate kinase
MTLAHITGHVVMIMAPMGSGKGSLIAHALETLPLVTRTVSCTTREKRPKEQEGVDYYFITREAFEEKIEAGAFLEWAEFSGNLYGTLRSELLSLLEHGHVVICEIDMQGVVQLSDLIPRENRTLVYIEAGDWECLKARALGRAPISEAELGLRFERYLHEREYAHTADVVIHNNDGEVEEAKKHLVSVLEDIITQVTQHA